MGISSFFKRIIQNARESRTDGDKPVLYNRDGKLFLIKEKELFAMTNDSTPKERRIISDEVFESDSFVKEILAFALWKYNENKCDYSIAKQCLLEMADIRSTEMQADKVIENLKLWNRLIKEKYNEEGE
ncbi:hypothetical protein [Mucilaginibacter pedocola]|uniref:Uncharacterized protein n=1 Tax=Mucilaginibacter pedocola TaxID=1792845 RepID=A0A1S9PK36_9SPHI|nr:hypothetical protein [Mucilaginibacter pedocola]OOQ61326.1 hypothetical protein BC343_20300 [Mucilaginibacter pedocola]